MLSICVYHFLLILLPITIIYASLKCLDEDGKAVDWFIGIKVPDYIRGNPQNGFQYFLMTSDDPKWQLSRCNVIDSCGALYRTLQQIYEIKKNDNNSVSIIYNDEIPKEKDTTLRWHDYFQYGHMKGALAFSAQTTGFWMIHSVPKFPGYSDYTYPSTGLKYGQHFFCITFPYTELQKIAHQLSIARPNTFFENLPEWIETSIPDLKTVAKNLPPRSPVTSSVANITSLSGTILTSFSKSRSFGADLYSNLVTPTLKTNVFMEGWIDGPGDLNSTCTAGREVLRVTDVTLRNNSWSTSHDHCKWVVSANASWVCLGDINRQKSQFQRGGGTMCMPNSTVWSEFRHLVGDFQPCN